MRLSHPTPPDSVVPILWRCSAPSSSPFAPACLGKRIKRSYGELNLAARASARESKLACACQDRILETYRRVGGDGRVRPGSTGTRLPEYRNLQSVGAQPAIENVDRDFQALIGVVGCRIPVRDDDAPKGIGGRQRHERQRVERGMPEIGVHAERDFAAAALDSGRTRLRIVVVIRGSARCKQQSTENDRQNPHGPALLKLFGAPRRFRPQGGLYWPPRYRATTRAGRGAVIALRG